MNLDKDAKKVKDKIKKLSSKVEEENHSGDLEMVILATIREIIVEIVRLATIKEIIAEIVRLVTLTL